MREFQLQTEKARAPRSTLPRRHLLRAVAAAALAICGSAVAFVRTRGYSVPATETLAVLSPWQFVVVQHAARRITAPDRPGDASIPTADDLDVASFVDAWMARMPPRICRDLRRFFAYLEHVAPLSAGYLSRFTRMEPQAQDHVLAAVERSSSDLLRAGFDGLRSLIFLAYYRAPSTWRIIGYDGPLVGRPTSGWL